MKIFVTKLSWDTTDQDLEDLFGQYGNVEEAKVIKDRDTGRSRGFAFVEMSDDDAARQAIEELHETDLDGRTIVVREAEDRGGRRGGGGGRGGYRGGGGGGGYRGGGGGYGGGGRY